MSSPAPSPIYRTEDGREWWIDESHPQTDAIVAFVRAVEHGSLTHSTVISRARLTKIEAEPGATPAEELHCVQGQGFNPYCGGFDSVLIDGRAYNAQHVARVMRQHEEIEQNVRGVLKLIATTRSMVMLRGSMYTNALAKIFGSPK